MNDDYAKMYFTRFVEYVKENMESINEFVVDYKVLEAFIPEIIIHNNLNYIKYIYMIKALMNENNFDFLVNDGVHFKDVNLGKESKYVVIYRK